MHNVQDYSVLYNNVVRPVICDGWHCRIDTPKTQIHDRSLYWPNKGTSIKIGDVKLVLWAHTSPRGEMLRSG
jgi:hypothetical protein